MTWSLFRFRLLSILDVCTDNPKGLDELTTGVTATTESIATREGCSARKVNMTISLAFLAPDLVKAAIEGRLPHGMGVARLSRLAR